MTDHTNLPAAKKAKNDEFYTQYSDIEAEMNAYVEYNPDVFRGKTVLLPCDDPEWSNFTKYFAANFERFGLKKLISTSYAGSAGSQQLTPFESKSPSYDADKNATHGKLFTLTRNDGHVDSDDLEFTKYLDGDGDFRSEEVTEEVTKLRDEADVIATNPAFSLFREFLAWIMEAGKQFAIIGNTNAITYKEVFPLLQHNKIWLGHSHPKEFIIPAATERKNTYVRSDGVTVAKFGNICWFTNLDLYKRHQPLLLDTMEHNLKFNKKLKKKFESNYGEIKYPHYDNYDAIEVPFVDAIPSDYRGTMGVPITFLDRYDPDQFEIIDINPHFFSLIAQGFPKPKQLSLNNCGGKDPYARILIRPKKGTK